MKNWDEVYEKFKYDNGNWFFTDWLKENYPEGIVFGDSDGKAETFDAWLLNQREIGIKNGAPSGECELLYEIIKKFREMRNKPSPIPNLTVYENEVTGTKIHLRKLDIFDEPPEKTIT